jgi:membrane-associated phospholipid phosphatase
LNFITGSSDRNFRRLQLPIFGTFAPELRSKAAVYGFTQELIRRVQSHRRLKQVGFAIFYAAFFPPYIALLRHPLFPVTEIPATALDRMIGFHPMALVLYLSLWVYISLPPLLIDRRRDLFTYAAAAVLLGITGLAIYLFFPTVAERPQIDWSVYTGFFHLKHIDRAGNACPSLHAAFAVFTAVNLQRLIPQLFQRRRRQLVAALSWLWCLAIVYSTMATKQHVALDVYAGLAFGAAGAALQISALRGRLPTTAAGSYPARWRAARD